MEVKLDNIDKLSKMSLQYNERTFQIVGAAMEVHKTLGRGFLEAVYAEALAIELEARHIPFEREKKIQIFYKNRPLSQYYVADFFCYGSIIVELKAVESLLPQHSAQVINYLKATNKEVGVLLNFGDNSLVHKRFYNYINNSSNP